MSDQPLDLRRSLQLVRRHKFVVATAALLGMLAGAGYAIHYPSMVSSTAVVVLPPSVRDPATQVVIAGSDPVLSAALPKITPATSLQALDSHVQVRRPTSMIIKITTQGKTAVQAESAANAVASSYIAFASSGKSPAGRAQPGLLQRAGSASGTPLPVHVAIIAAFGLLLGLLLAAIGVLGLSRRDRRLRRRDDIADVIGIPVLASVSVAHPSSPASWTRLLVDYEPNAADSWRLRKALYYLELTETISANGSAGGSSVTVLSLASDAKALALGPQLALFAASLGIPTVLAIGPQQDANTAAALRAACAAGALSPRQPKHLRLVVADQDSTLPQWRAGLSVVVAVIDGDEPLVAGMLRTSATVLGVSAGAVTAEQLARVAASAATNGRHLAGILVADPDPGDHTTGRVPQLTRLPQRRMPTRVTGMPAKTRRLTTMTRHGHGDLE
jgi:capsular polysaccharide biosynthesis protein